MINCYRWRLYEMWTSVFINKVLLEPAMVSHLHTVCGCFCIAAADLSQCDRLHGPQSLKYLLSDPSQKKFAAPCNKRGEEKTEKWDTRWILSSAFSYLFRIILDPLLALAHFAFIRQLRNLDYFSHFTDEVCIFPKFVQTIYLAKPFHICV